MRLEYEQLWLKILMIRCPAGPALADCPVHDFRGLSRLAAEEAIKVMAKKEVNALIDHHKTCFLLRHAKDGAQGWIGDA